MTLGRLCVTDWPATSSCTLADGKRGTRRIRFQRLHRSVVASLSASQLSWAGRGRFA
jgi:hypothetical protein